MSLEEIKNTFEILDDSEEKLSFVIDLGKQLSPYPEDKKDDEHKIYGCSSNVWFNPKSEDGKYYFDFESDALIVIGLLFIIKQIFDGKTLAQIKQINAMDFFDKVGLKPLLSNQRQSGLLSIIEKIECMK